MRVQEAGEIVSLEQNLYFKFYILQGAPRAALCPDS